MIDWITVITLRVLQEFVGASQFIVKQTCERETALNTLFEQEGSFFAFCGSSHDKWFSILGKGLFQTVMGVTGGSGVFLSMFTDTGFTGGSDCTNSYRACEPGGHCEEFVCFGVCQVAGKPADYAFIKQGARGLHDEQHQPVLLVRDEELACLRFLVVVPCSQLLSKSGKKVLAYKTASDSYDFVAHVSFFVLFQIVFLWHGLTFFCFHSV